MKKTVIYLIIFLVLLAAAFGFYYVTLPAFNIHSPGTWAFIVCLALFLLLIYYLVNFYKPNKKVVKVWASFIILLILVYIVGTVLSSPIVNSKKYKELCEISTRDFLSDIEQISYDEIPVLDKASAEKLGLRKMGSMVDMVSQFEVDNMYTQVNYNSKPTRVTPLDYASFIKWLTNRKNGIPAYIKIDMATQNVDCVKLEEGMKYSFSEYFGRNVARYLRFNYPTYIFEPINFEIDDAGTPYWICPVRDYTIGLFGGIKIDRVVLLNAVTGELKEYKIEDVPTWIDKVYSAELLTSYYNYYGMLKNGYLNSILSQKDCLKTTEGYNYLALEDDVWVYTGVTSVSGDESNVGFVLMNQRTSETRYYEIAGAEEYSAMSSAEGQVQHLGYRATFPLLLNIANEPTYFIALKDNAGLVKSYAMVNIEKYQIVAIGDSINSCEKAYINLLKDNGMSVEQKPETNEITGIISSKTEVIIDGDTHYFITIGSDTALYDVNVSENLNILKINEKFPVKAEFIKGADADIIIKISQ